MSGESVPPSAGPAGLEPLNVVQFKPRDPNAPPIQVKEVDYDGCQHKAYRLLIDRHLRTVECSKCGERLDPVECLIQWANRYREADYRYADTKKALDQYERMNRVIEKKVSRNLMTPEERKMSGFEIQALHAQNGCPRERMWFQRDMIYCFCGYGMNANSYPKLAEEVRQAHEAVKARSTFQIASSAPKAEGPEQSEGDKC